MFNLFSAQEYLQGGARLENMLPGLQGVVGLVMACFAAYAVFRIRAEGCTNWLRPIALFTMAMILINNNYWLPHPQEDPMLPLPPRLGS